MKNLQLDLKKKDAKSTEYDLHCECVEDVCTIVI